MNPFHPQSHFWNQGLPPTSCSWDRRRVTLVQVNFINKKHARCGFVLDFYHYTLCRTRLQLWSTLLAVGPFEEKALKSSAGWQLLSWIRRIWESFFTGLTVHFGLVPSGQINYPRVFEGFASEGEAPHVQTHISMDLLCVISAGKLDREPDRVTLLSQLTKGRLAASYELSLGHHQHLFVSYFARRCFPLWMDENCNYLASPSFGRWWKEEKSIWLPNEHWAPPLPFD